MLCIDLLHHPLGGVGAGEVLAAIWVHNLGLAAVIVGQATVEDEIDLLRYVPERYREAIDQFLTKNWIALVATCYAHHLQEGRGLMGLEDQIVECVISRSLSCPAHPAGKYLANFIRVT